MKYILPLLFFFISLNVFGQVPQLINYQAVARDSYGNPLPSGQFIRLRFTIHDISQSGTIVFQETDTITINNQFGLFTFLIGNGTVDSGSIGGINWAGGNKYLQVEFDPTGGTNYDSMGTTQIVGVPYAQNSQTSQNAANAGNWYDYAVYEETAVPGNPPSTSLANGGWASRYLNYPEVQSGSSITINANDTSINLLPGTYHIAASAPFAINIPYLGGGISYDSVNSVLRIREITTDSTLLVGQGEHFTNYGQGTLTGSIWQEQHILNLDGIVRITTASKISLQHYIYANFSGYCLGDCYYNAGNAVNSGETEIYSRILIERIQ